MLAGRATRPAQVRAPNAPLPRRTDAPGRSGFFAVERSIHQDTPACHSRTRPGKAHLARMLNTSTLRRPGGPIALAARSADSRRLRRRVVAADRLYCGTNGCTTHLVLDPQTGVASCPICGFRRTIG